MQITLNRCLIKIGDDYFLSKKMIESGFFVHVDNYDDYCQKLLMVHVCYYFFLIWIIAMSQIMRLLKYNIIL